MSYQPALPVPPTLDFRSGALSGALPRASSAGAVMHELCVAAGRLARAARRRDAAGTHDAALALARMASDNHLPKVRWHARALLGWRAEEALAATRLDALLAELDFAVAAAVAQLGARGEH